MKFCQRITIASVGKELKEKYHPALLKGTANVSKMEKAVVIANVLTAIIQFLNDFFLNHVPAEPDAQATIVPAKSKEKHVTLKVGKYNFFHMCAS